MDYAYTLQHVLKTQNGIQPKQEYIAQWLRERPPRSSDNRDIMHKSILQHFLSKDLRDTSIPTIPDNFGSDSLESFPPAPGIVLQIVDTRDISNSTHSLLNNLSTVAPVRQVYVRRATEDDVRFPRGTLRWTLTDGYTEVVALEYERINQLSLTTPFGCKVFIKPCEVRQGMLFLRPSNIKILGGQVESLFGGNMLEELERRFKAKLGLQPIATTESEIMHRPALPQPPPLSAATTTTTTTSTTSAPPSRSTAPVPSNNNHDDYDEFDDDLDMQMLMEMEQTYSTSTRSRSQQQQQLLLQPPTSTSSIQAPQRAASMERHAAEDTDQNDSFSDEFMDAMSLDLEDMPTTTLAANQAPPLINHESTLPLARQASELNLNPEPEAEPQQQQPTLQCTSDQKSMSEQQQETKAVSEVTVTQVVEYLRCRKSNPELTIQLPSQVTVQAIVSRPLRIGILPKQYNVTVQIEDLIMDLSLEEEEREKNALCIMLPNDFIAKAWGLTSKEYCEIKEERGTKYVQDTYSKPWGKSFRNIQCKVELDLESTEEDKTFDAILPKVISFEQVTDSV
ncbi:hypothetical protein BDB00DRAFT_938634 [Zychaea mexicana]|uniref:uncharacterized protein n=1 Tax=Zychaea mexicana TaxID=64656 RepID=UPI0022FF00C1|nr:uncharacterized protein BDB00DRAFT_938634 [Zychaea mexicana]KAI9494100.1 hypothetical protein BDB00DRAFT_938634 [Zychaea mexicana]